MKLYTVNILLTLVVFLLVAACSTIPKPTDPDSTLLVIRSVKEVDRDSSSGFNYWLIMEDDSRHRIKFDLKENYTFIKGLSPGKVTTKLFQASLRGKTSSTSGSRYFNYPLRVHTTMKAGCYSLFPATIIYRENMGAERKFTFDVVFEEIDASEMKKILHELDEMNLSEVWARAE